MGGCETKRESFGYRSLSVFQKIVLSERTAVCHFHNEYVTVGVDDFEFEVVYL